MTILKYPTLGSLKKRDREKIERLCLFILTRGEKKAYESMEFFEIGSGNLRILYGGTLFGKVFLQMGIGNKRFKKLPGKIDKFMPRIKYIMIDPLPITIKGVLAICHRDCYDIWRKKNK